MAINRNEKTLKAFGQHLKNLRQVKGLTTREFADLADVAYSQVWTLESGRGDPSLTTLLALARGLEIDVEELLSFNRSSKP